MKLSGALPVLIDCSTFLSGALYPYGKPRKILRLWQEQKYELIVTKQIFKEYKEKIEPVSQKMKKNYQFAAEYLGLIKKEANWIIPIKVDPMACRDPNDLKYLAAAKAVEANFIIASDKDLLVLKKFGPTKILTPHQFLKIINARH